MASIKKRPLKSGGASYRAVVKSCGREVASKTFSKRKDAVAWAARIEGDRERMAALGNPDGARLFRDVAALVLAVAAKDRSRDYLVRWWCERIGDTAIGRIEVGELRRHLNEYAEARAPASANRLKAACSVVFRHAQREGWIITNPARQLAHKTEPKGRVRWLKPDERKRLLAACDASGWPRLGLLVRFLLGTGCRLGEALALRWCDVDLTERRAYLATSKSGDGRVLTLPGPLAAELRRCRQIGVGLVFGRADAPGEPFHFRKHWNAARAAADLPDLRLHDLRHDVASQLAMAGATLHEVAEVLGHRSVQTTKRYAHLSTDHKQALTDRVLADKL